MLLIAEKQWIICKREIYFPFSCKKDKLLALVRAILNDLLKKVKSNIMESVFGIGAYATLFSLML